MLNPIIISALTDIEELCRNRKNNSHISDEEFRDMVYNKAKRIVDSVEIDEIGKEHDLEEEAIAAEEKFKREEQQCGEVYTDANDLRKWAENHGAYQTKKGWIV